jgi:hypothetical protein
MAAKEDSLLNPITAAADRSELASESTTLSSLVLVLVSEGSGLPRVLQEAFDDGARRPLPGPWHSWLRVKNPSHDCRMIIESIAGHRLP